MDPVVRQSVEGTVGLLVDGAYEAVATMTDNQRLDATAIRTAIEEYGRTLVRLPAGWEDDASTLVVEVGDQPRPTLAVTVDFWTIEEGHSDLSIELELTEVGRGLWSTRIDDIRVL